MPAPLPPHLELYHEIADPADPARPSRLCVCLSDLHFTDGTVGNQSAEEPAWNTFFHELESTCLNHGIEELTLVLDGDVVDLIRTARWAKAGVYPWQRDDAQFPVILREIIREIARIHAQRPGQFFSLLKNLPTRLQGKGPNGQDITVQTLVLLGNHDKEILADDEALAIFYHQCLGQPVEDIGEDYRLWVGRQYGDETLFQDRQRPPWLPFYHGDLGFRLFLTHGQWRDASNCRGIAGWKAGDGWEISLWQASRFEPFRAPCFGDTVAAGLLSNFIFKAKQQLEEYRCARSGAELDPETGRLQGILEELDLYRPTYSAIERILVEARRRREQGRGSELTEIIETNLYQSLRQWLSWDFTVQSAPGSLRFALPVANGLVKLLGMFPGHKIELETAYWILKFTASWQTFWGELGHEIRLKDLLSFPAFLSSYRQCGFQIHGEGHTHIALQQEVNFDEPPESQNYTYINFGAWRDQMVKKLDKGYRRQGIGRSLYVFDLAAEVGDAERRFDYFVKDTISWGGPRDQL